MPITDQKLKREYQRNWIAKRRAEWIKANSPCQKCGSEDRLCATYKSGRKLKRKVSSIWHLKDPKRSRILTRLEVLCKPCSDRRAYRRVSIKLKGNRPANAKLSFEQAREVMAWVKAGISERKTAAFFGVDRATVHGISTGHAYKEAFREEKPRGSK